MRSYEYSLVYFVSGLAEPWNSAINLFLNLIMQIENNQDVTAQRKRSSEHVNKNSRKPANRNTLE